MNEPRPFLKAVGPEPRSEAEAGAPARRQPEERSSRRFGWIAALLVLAVIALGVQTLRVGALSNEVTRLSTELVGTRAALVAYEGRLATVREIVGDLSKRLVQLDDLVCVETTLADSSTVRFFGVVDVVRKRYEGQAFDSDAFRHAEGTLPVDVSYAVPPMSS